MGCLSLQMELSYRIFRHFQSFFFSAIGFWDTFFERAPGLNPMPESRRRKLFDRLEPNVSKAGAIQSQGAKGVAVVIYCNPLATPDLDCSGFPVKGAT
jgi:hypothetical protein